MTFSIMNLLLVVALGIVAVFVAKKLFKLDTKVENRRREAAQLAANMRALGYRELPELFIDYSVGDYSSMVHKMTTLARVFTGGEAAILGEFDEVFVRLLDIKLNTEEGRFLVENKLEMAKKLLNK